MNYKFKPGDKVTVRKDLMTDYDYKMLSGKTPNDGVIATPSMKALRGKQVVIKGYDHCDTVSCYRVKESSRYWTDEMFDRPKNLICKSLL
jgi:hypothetical protein|nr:MAG TPA: hypothetical protein [Caudoviricetes sp.]